MRPRLLRVLGVFLIVGGVILLGASAYAMYRLGVSESVDGASYAKRGISAAVGGTALFLGGLWATGEARRREEQTEGE